MGEKVFITGASGCLGANLVRRLSGEEHDVHAFIYPGTDHPFLQGLKINRFEGDVLDRDSLRKAMHGCRQVYHTAAFVSYFRRDHEKMIRVNVEGTKNVMELALELGVEKVVYTSTAMALGLPERADAPFDENASWDNRYDRVGYIHSKRLAEREVLSAHHKGLKAVIINECPFYGQGDINIVQGELVRNIRNGALKFAPPGGNSVVSVDDAVEGHLLAMQRGRSGERYILSSEYLSFIELLNIIAEESGARKIKWVLPGYSFFLVYALAGLVEFFTVRFKLDMKLTPQVILISYKPKHYRSDKARQELGWVPRQSFRQAIRKAIEFYDTYNLLGRKN